MERKVVIITGASQGIGKATAELLTDAIVIDASRSSGYDVTNPDDRKKIIADTLDEHGRIDVLVNNAGMGIYGSIEETDLADFRTVLELNLVAPLSMMQLVIPVMRKQGGGTIVNVSSRSAQHYFPLIGAYASTKHALNCVSLTAREELAKDNITVGVVMPGIVDSDFGHDADEKGLAIQAARKAEYGVLPVQVAAQKVVEAILSGAAETLAI